jgi:phosphatidylserine/phosphatidylglycerophosphate/cardiolipin synthase-like enzyme
MRAEFIVENVWDVLTEAAKTSKKPAHVAVAYFGKGAAELLPLPAGSHLVVDASEAAVSSGQTHPDDLRRMRQRKVAVYSKPSLHAKVFAFDNALYVGSANVSKHSANVLQEAVICIVDTAIAGIARRFVQDLALEPLGPKEIERLQKLYKPPRFNGGGGKKHRGRQKTSVLRVAQIKVGHLPEHITAAFDAGRKRAAKKRSRPSDYRIEDFYWLSRSSAFCEGELVIQVLKDGRRRTVSPPGRVIHTEPYEHGKTRRTLVYVEVPDLDRKPFSSLEAEEKKLLARGGLKGPEAAKRLLQFWKDRSG